MCFMETNGIFGQKAIYRIIDIRCRYRCFPSCACVLQNNMSLLPSLSNMIIDSASRWVGGYVVVRRLIGGSVVLGFNKTQEKICLD